MMFVSSNAKIKNSDDHRLWPATEYIKAQGNLQGYVFLLSFLSFLLKCSLKVLFQHIEKGETKELRLLDL